MFYTSYTRIPDTHIRWELLRKLQDLWMKVKGRSRRSEKVLILSPKGRHRRYYRRAKFQGSKDG